MHLLTQYTPSTLSDLSRLGIDPTHRRGWRSGDSPIVDYGLSDYLSTAVQPAPVKQVFLDRKSQWRKVEIGAFHKWLEWVQSPAYAQSRMRFQERAAKRKPSKPVSPPTRADYVAEFESYLASAKGRERGLGEWNRLADSLKSLVDWAASRHTQMATRRGIQIGDVALDFGRANCAEKLAVVLARSDSTRHNTGQHWIADSHKHPKTGEVLNPLGGYFASGCRCAICRLAAGGKSLPFLATMWFRRGIEQGRGIGYTDELSWLPSDDCQEATALGIALPGTESTARDFTARKRVVARKLMRVAQGVPGPRGAALQRQARLGWLLASGRRLDDQAALDAGYKSLRCALDTLRKTLPRAHILSAAQSDVDQGGLRFELPASLEHQARNGSQLSAREQRKRRIARCTLVGLPIPPANRGKLAWGRRAQSDALAADRLVSAPYTPPKQRGFLFPVQVV